MLNRQGCRTDVNGPGDSPADFEPEIVRATAEEGRIRISRHFGLYRGSKPRVHNTFIGRRLLIQRLRSRMFPFIGCHLGLGFTCALPFEIPPRSVIFLFISGRFLFHFRRRPFHSTVKAPDGIDHLVHQRDLLFWRKLFEELTDPLTRDGMDRSSECSLLILGQERQQCCESAILPPRCFKCPCNRCGL